MQITSTRLEGNTDLPSEAHEITSWSTILKDVNGIFLLEYFESFQPLNSSFDMYPHVCN